MNAFQLLIRFLKRSIPLLQLTKLDYDNASKEYWVTLILKCATCIMHIIQKCRDSSNRTCLIDANLHSITEKKSNII